MQIYFFVDVGLVIADCLFIMQDKFSIYSLLICKFNFLGSVVIVRLPLDRDYQSSDIIYNYANLLFSLSGAW